MPPSPTGERKWLKPRRHCPGPRAGQAHPGTLAHDRLPVLNGPSTRGASPLPRAFAGTSISCRSRGAPCQLLQGHLREVRSARAHWSSPGRGASCSSLLATWRPEAGRWPRSVQTESWGQGPETPVVPRSPGHTAWPSAGDRTRRESWLRRGLSACSPQGTPCPKLQAC